MTISEEKDANIQNEDDFGFNPYGSGPIPIRPRGAHDDQPDELRRDDGAITVRDECVGEVVC